MNIGPREITMCEWIAFISWAIHFTTLKPIKYKLFTVYLGIIAITEFLNLNFGSTKDSIFNSIIIYFNVPLEICFLSFFLLSQTTIKKWWTVGIITLYLVFYILEAANIANAPKNFNSLSYGVGNLLLIVAVLLAIRGYLKTDDRTPFYKTSFFWIIIAIAINYTASFPYSNFRDFFWSDKNYYSIAYFLHYTSHYLNCILYLLFAFASIWKKT
jgi:hypothetical protein